jgi:molybdate transport system substrate-binding protein
VPHIRIKTLGLLAVATLVLTGCGGTSTPASPPADTSGVTGQITVLAAASLTEAFTQIETGFEQAHPAADVVYSFAGSSTLAKQINQGAPADVFASANTAQMQNVVDAGSTAGEPAVFTTNTLQIVVPAGNPAGVQGLPDLGKQELTVAICAEQVPCGAAAQEAFRAAGVTPAPDTLEQDVKAVLTKVSLGEADAGLVYRTDVASATGDVEGIDFPEAARAVNEYPIVALTGAPNPAGARAFVDYVRSDSGQAVLGQFGFGPATP